MNEHPTGPASTSGGTSLPHNRARPPQYGCSIGRFGYLCFLLLPPIYLATLPGSTTIVAVMRGCSEQKYS